MRWLTHVRREREGGATAVLMALLLVVLVGITGLAVDGGATMAKQQELQNGADAAALAAAQECAKSGCGSIDAVAGPYGEYNVKNVTTDTPVTTTFDPDTSAQTVTATVSQVKNHFFLSVVGVGPSALRASATATWGAPLQGPAIMPLAFAECQFEAQGGASGNPATIFFTKTSETECTLPESGNTMPAGFAYITDGSGSCSAEVSVDGWIDSQNGNTPQNCDPSELKNLVGTVVLLPIFDACRASNINNAPGCTEYPISTGSERQYHIKAFAAFELLGMNFGGQFKAPTPPPCGGEDRCVRGAFVEYVSLEDAWKYIGAPEDLGADVVYLID